MSMKKSLLVLIVVIAAVTVFSVMQNGGDSMQIDMDDAAITFSGIGDFSKTIAYSEIRSVELVEAGDTELLGSKEELYKAGFGPSFQDGEAWPVSMEITYAYFVTTRTDSLIVLTLSDDTLMLFNYNSTSGTEAIYEMLLENVQ